jgi:hypothetical protein
MCLRSFPGLASSGPTRPARPRPVEYLVVCPEHEPLPAVELERRFDLFEVLEPPRSRDAADAEVVDQVCRHLWLPEREDVRLGAGLEERDLHRPLADRVVLAHELVEAAVSEQTVPVLVYVHAV